MRSGPSSRAGRRRVARDLLLERLQSHGAKISRVVLTDNRRVMASLTDGGKTLRLQRAFLDAPDPVIKALAHLFSRRPLVRRASARAVVREYLATLPVPDRAPQTRGRRTRSSDRPYLQSLRAEFERVNAEFFDGTLPDVPIYLSGRMKRRNGHFCSEPLEIVISRRLCMDAEVGEAERTLRHEMIHLWQHEQGRKPGHGRDFRELARQLDIHPRAKREVAWESFAS